MSILQLLLKLILFSLFIPLPKSLPFSSSSTPPPPPQSDVLSFSSSLSFSPVWFSSCWTFFNVQQIYELYEVIEYISFYYFSSCFHYIFIFYHSFLLLDLSLGTFVCLICTTTRNKNTIHKVEHLFDDCSTTTTNQALLTYFVIFNTFSSKHSSINSQELCASWGAEPKFSKQEQSKWMFLENKKQSPNQLERI